MRMTTLSSKDRDMLLALTWYMTARKTALRAALSFRTPLTTIAHTDMRVHYSAYFQNLLSATELMCELTLVPTNSFKTELYARFVFPGFQDGKSNYKYIKYLRNAIVHRGYDITSAAHVDGDFLMLVAEPSFQNNATNLEKRKTFHAFDTYVLNIIAKCESVISGVIFDALHSAGVFQANVDSQAAIAESHTAIQNSHMMPEWTKVMAAALELKPEWFVEINDSMKDKLREALLPSNTLSSA